MEKKRGASIILFMLGLVFFLSGEASITGAFLGSGIASGVSSFLGLGMMFVASILFVAEEGGLEKTIKVTDSTEDNKVIKRLAKRAMKNQKVKKDLDHLSEALLEGNFQAGLGSPGHIQDTDIFYLRGRPGGRLFYHKTDESKDEITYEIVGKAAGVGKKRNEYAVIKKLKELYS